jgi:hypothetical protein
MQDVGIFIIGAAGAAFVALAACSSGQAGTSSSGGGSGTTTTHSSSSSGVTSTSTSSSATGAASSGSTGSSSGAVDVGHSVCTIPSPQPSQGSCVSPSLGGAAAPPCNPITNEGCSGTDVCIPTTDNTTYRCWSGITGSVCEGCDFFCGKGNVCVRWSMADPTGVCTSMCCTDADCGGGASTCSKTAYEGMSLPFGVGLCVHP